MRFRRGDVVLVLFPDSNLRTAKRRPVLIVQADDLNSGLAQYVAAMITSNLARGAHPSRVSIAKASEDGQRMGLLTDSIVMTDNLATIRENEMHKSIGHCQRMQAVDAALRHTLALG